MYSLRRHELLAISPNLFQHEILRAIPVPILQSCHTYIIPEASIKTPGPNELDNEYNVIDHCGAIMFGEHSPLWTNDLKELGQSAGYGDESGSIRFPLRKTVDNGVKDARVCVD